MSDLRIAARTLLKHPGFTAVAALTLALGIGANTVVFSFVDGILLKPLPYADPDRLVRVWDVQLALAEAPMSYPEYLDWRAQDRLFSASGAMFGDSVNLTGEGEPERVDGVRASASFLRLLGVRPAAGRLFADDEESPAAPRVALISHGLWQRRFGGEPTIVGRALTLDGQSTTVVGVLPAGFSFGDGADVWMPLRLETDEAPRGLHFLTVVARLRPGLALDRAQAEAEPIAAHFRDEYHSTHGVKLAALRDSLVADTRSLLVLLGGAVTFVLLIACTNVAGLLLARTADRAREIAIRLSLGTSRGRLVRQLLVESTLLALAGGALGALAAGWGVEALKRVVGDRLPRIDEVGVDLRVLAFALGASLLTGLLFGLVPAFQATRTDLQAVLREGGRGGDPGKVRHRLRAALVVAEVALSLVLLIRAGLLIRSFLAAVDTSPGFSSGGLIALDVSPPAARYPEFPQQEAFFRGLEERLAALPGVRGVSEVSHLPLSGRDTNGGFEIEGREWPEGERPLVDKRVVGVGYFQLMGVPLLRGRDFTDHDVAGVSPQAMVVSDSFARRYFPGEDPIGKRIDFGWMTEGWQEIVGVVGDVKHSGLDRTSLPVTYLPYRQQPALAAPGAADRGAPRHRRSGAGDGRRARRGPHRRPRAADRRAAHDGRGGQPVDLHPPADHRAAGGPRRPRPGDGGGGPVRPDLLPGRPAHPRDRHPHGPGGAPNPRPPPGGVARPPPGAVGRRGGRRRQPRPHPRAGEPPLPGLGHRSAHLRRRPGGAAGGRAPRLLPPRPSRLPARPDGGDARRVGAEPPAARFLFARGDPAALAPALW